MLLPSQIVQDRLEQEHLEVLKAQERIAVQAIIHATLDQLQSEDSRLRQQLDQLSDQMKRYARQALVGQLDHVLKGKTASETNQFLCQGLGLPSLESPIQV